MEIWKSQIVPDVDMIHELYWMIFRLLSFPPSPPHWQWTPPLWPSIWLAVWRGCAEVAVPPTSAWLSCGSSCSRPAPTCAGSGPFTRLLSEEAPQLNPPSCLVTSVLMAVCVSLQDWQLFQLYGLLLCLHGPGGDQHHPDHRHSWLGSVVRILTHIWEFIFLFIYFV